MSEFLISSDLDNIKVTREEVLEEFDMVRKMKLEKPENMLSFTAIISDEEW